MSAVFWDLRQAMYVNSLGHSSIGTPSAHHCFAVEAPNFKHQTSNKLQWPKFKKFENWNLEYICYLDFVIWNFQCEALVGRSYTEGTTAFLPSSWTNITSCTLGFSPHPPVSVCGTNTIIHDHEAFLDTWSTKIPDCSGLLARSTLTPKIASCLATG